MKKRKLLVMLLAALLLAFGVVMSAFANDEHVAHDCALYEECYGHGFCFDGMILTEIIDAGEGVFVYVYTMSENQLQSFIVPFSSLSACCANPLWPHTPTIEIFHTVRIHPLPRECVSVRIQFIHTCARCWTSTSTYSLLRGCGVGTSC